jgi:hypothetical protein
MTFQEIKVEVPPTDCDIILQLPGGETVTVQCRPSNADVNYNGSLDIILPTNQHVECYMDDDLVSAPQADADRPNVRLAKQIVTGLPGAW